MMMMIMRTNDDDLDKTRGKEEGEELRNVVGRKLRREFPYPYDDNMVMMMMMISMMIMMMMMNMMMIMPAMR